MNTLQIVILTAFSFLFGALIIWMHYDLKIKQLKKSVKGYQDLLKTEKDNHSKTIVELALAQTLLVKEKKDKEFHKKRFNEVHEKIRGCDFVCETWGDLYQEIKRKWSKAPYGFVMDMRDLYFSSLNSGDGIEEFAVYDKKLDEFHIITAYFDYKTDEAQMVALLEGKPKNLKYLGRL